jgi:hypothetical protein
MKSIGICNTQFRFLFRLIVVAQLTLSEGLQALAGDIALYYY